MIAQMETRAHAILSASAAHRWLNCPPSARMEDAFPESQSTYADEGRLAHEIAELKLRKYFVEPMGPRAFNNRLKKLQSDSLYQDEMLRHTDVYLEYIQSIAHGFSMPPYVAIEKRLDFSSYVQDGFGTGDCVIIGGETLRVTDFKYGKGVPVSAEDNPQMKLYALGAYGTYAFLYPIKTIITAIVQPRLDSVSEHGMPLDELLAWGESIKPIAQMAFQGKGDFAPGDHCRFCRAKALCRARSEFNTGLEEFHQMKPPLISNTEVGEILVRALDLAKWVSDLQEYALGECLIGNDIPGWKAVHGRSTRQFTDQDAAFKVLLDGGTEEAMLYERKPLTLASVEKLIGKPQFNSLLSVYVNTPPGKPTLAPVSDKREAITRTTAEDDFKNGGNENE